MSKILEAIGTILLVYTGVLLSISVGAASGDCTLYAQPKNMQEFSSCVWRTTPEIMSRKHRNVIKYLGGE